MKYYFALTEKAFSSIATIQAETDEELTLKSMEALSEHYDETIEIKPLSMNDYINNDGGAFHIEMNNYDCEIQICQTWLY